MAKGYNTLQKEACIRGYGTENSAKSLVSVAIQRILAIGAALPRPTLPKGLYTNAWCMESSSGRSTTMDCSPVYYVCSNQAHWFNLEFLGLEEEEIFVNLDKIASCVILRQVTPPLTLLKAQNSKLEFPI